MNGAKPRATPATRGMTPTSPKYPNKSMSQFSPNICANGTAFSLKIWSKERDLRSPESFK